MTVASARVPVPVSPSRVRVRPSSGPSFDVAYERRGAGEPVVLLHGSATTGRRGSRC